MEHIVQFGISIDDDKIKQTIENNVMQQVAGAIKNDCIKALVGRKNITNYDYTQKIKDMINDLSEKIPNSKKRIHDALIHTERVNLIRPIPRYQQAYDIEKKAKEEKKKNLPKY